MLAYTDIGQGTPIVFIHGLGSRRQAWSPQRPLAEKYRLIMPDLRGHGETVTETDITMENFAKDIIELLDYLEVDRAYVCGLSLGGIIAQELYKQAPERILGLILANTTSYISPLASFMVLHQAENHYKDKDFIDHIVAKGLYDSNYTPEAKGAFLIRDCYMEAARAPVGINYFTTLMKMNIPVLLIGGNADQVTLPVNQKMMNFFNSKAEQVILSDCGHLSNIEKSAQFNNCIDKFIKK